MAKDALSPWPIPTYLPAVHHPSAVLIQQFIINSYFQAVHFRNPGYSSALQTITVAPMRHIKQGVRRGREERAAGKQGLLRLGLLLSQHAVRRPMSHCTQPDVSLMSPCRLNVNEHMCLPKLGATRIPKAIHGMAFLGRIPVLIQMFISRYLGLGGTARKHKTSGHTVTERWH